MWLKYLSVSAWSIRSHLLLLVVAVSTPLSAVIGYGIYNDMQQSVAYAKASLRTLAITMVRNTGGKISEAKALIEQLAQRPLVKLVDAEHCDDILSDVLSLSLVNSNVGYVNLQGELVCSAIPQPDARKPIQFGHAPWFHTLVTRKAFTVSNPIIGPVSGERVSILSTPIWNARHEMVGAVLIGLNLEHFDPNIPAQFLPTESRYGFFSADGTMVWRNLDPEGVIGTRPNAEAARRIVEVRDGEFESLAIDGVVRFFSVVPMPDLGWTAFVGVPADTVFAEAKKRALTSATSALLAIALMLLLSALIARRISHPIATLGQTARTIHGGDLTVRAALTGPSEVAEVALTFNTMVDALERNHAQVQHMAFFDALTQLPNRRLLNDRLSQAMADSKRSGLYGALMFLDLDHFKPLNDAHGHEAGDVLLIEVARRLKGCVRETDTVSRFGGDEFVVMLRALDADQAQSTLQAGLVAEKMLLELAKPYAITVPREGLPDTSVEHRCTCSIGVALFRGHEVRETEILQHADMAMYDAKHAGRNSVHFFDQPGSVSTP